MTARPPIGAAPEAAVMLEHLYAALYCQLLLAEGGVVGGGVS